MIFTIHRIKNDSVVFQTENGESMAPYLTYEEPISGDEVLSTGAEDATLEELVQLCDHDAENTNAHEFCGCHRLLGAVLYREVGRPVGTRIMREIAIHGGLHRMNGVGSTTDAYEELNVGKAGCDWDGKYGG